MVLGLHLEQRDEIPLRSAKIILVQITARVVNRCQLRWNLLIYLIERSINAPSFETIEQMAKRLRVPVKALFEFHDARPSRSSR